MYHGKYEKKRTKGVPAGPEPEERKPAEQELPKPDVQEAASDPAEAAPQQEELTQEEPERKERKKIPLTPLTILIAAAAVLFLVIAIFDPSGKPAEETAPSTQVSLLDVPQEQTEATEATQETEPPTTAATEPVLVATASLGVTGDVLIHNTIFYSAQQSDGSYDFTGNYEYIKDYYERYDFMVANLEVTLGGTQAGEYSSYPRFNCPDSVIDALLDAGVDLLLTANNHTNDTAAHGIMRTQQVLQEKGMPYIGTRSDESAPNYRVQDVSGIAIGMVCYTYETGKSKAGRAMLNGLPLTEETNGLVNTFSYDDPEGFRAEMEAVLQAMENDGAQATVVFIHWGEEYQLSPNGNQETFAQILSDLGVDVIVGGHPHVIQPIDTLTGSQGNTTYCIYSVGNAIADQPRNKMNSAPNGHTEDGVVVGLEFEKWSDGSVKLSAMEVLPTWTDRTGTDGNRQFHIVPVDPEMSDWSGFGASVKEATESYGRTMAILGEGLNEIRRTLGQSEVPLTLIRISD